MTTTEAVLAWAIIVLLIFITITNDRVNRMESKVKTLQAYNEEVWRTFHEMRK